ncbi:MAG TPA: hypothetical protein G4O16_09660 [Dehalococcoidia bacterium]|nr:hypothetical protein [Dehalococcoidia bacterium]
MAFLWGTLAVIVVGAGAWWYGRTRAIIDIENQAITLLHKISDLIKEENPEKAQEIIKRFTSGELKIRNILIQENL